MSQTVPRYCQRCGIGHTMLDKVCRDCREAVPDWPTLEGSRTVQSVLNSRYWLTEKGMDVTDRRDEL